MNLLKDLKSVSYTHLDVYKRQALGFAAFAMFVKSYFRDFLLALDEDNTVIGTLKKVVYSFTSPWSIAYIILYITLVGGMMIILNILK